ncbi:hypothetical protein HYPSUDRAFT_66596 [Hypholoma sublateritium FD-334 SS-4]|uniref:Uncharacterized protein n=1 Tax=Hypholoma sublateritium (strain FD-334 SS-4) TaxID=945553 RepID=A0A0D2MHK7_HYPSF|nr:hypothetical protein HYPSUDRAFT_66596 [Hypholoma sublateritium FD-334 SS-4]
MGFASLHSQRFPNANSLQGSLYIRSRIARHRKRRNDWFDGTRAHVRPVTQSKSDKSAMSLRHKKASPQLVLLHLIHHNISSTQRNFSNDIAPHRTSIMLFTVGSLAGGGGTASALKLSLTAGLLAFSTDVSYPSKGHKPASGTLIAAASLAILSPAFINELSHIKHRHTHISSGTSHHEATRSRPFGKPTMTTGGSAGGASGALCAALAAAGIAGAALTIGGSGDEAEYGNFRDASDGGDVSDSDDTSSSSDDSEDPGPIGPVDEETAVKFINDTLEGAPPPPPPNDASELDDENNGPSDYGLGWWFILFALVVLAVLGKLVGHHLFGMDLFMDLWEFCAGKCIDNIDGQRITALLLRCKIHSHFVDVLAFLQRILYICLPDLGFATLLQSSNLSTHPYDHFSDDHSKFLALSEFLTPNVIRLRPEPDMCSLDAAPLHIDMPNIEYSIAPQISPKPSSNWVDTDDEIMDNGTTDAFGLSEQIQFREVWQWVLSPIYDFARQVWGTRAMLAAAAFVVTLYHYTRQRVQEILDSILDCVALATLTLLTPLVEMCARRVGSAQHIPRLELREPEMLTAQWVGCSQPITQLETQERGILAGTIVDEDEVMSSAEVKPSTTDKIPADCFKFTLDVYDSDNDEAYATNYQTEPSVETPDKDARPLPQDAGPCTSDDSHDAVADHDSFARMDSSSLAVDPGLLPPQEESSAACILNPAPLTISSADTVAPVEEKVMKQPMITMRLDTAAAEQKGDDEPAAADPQIPECQPLLHTHSLLAVDTYFSQGGSKTSSICRTSSCPSLIPNWAAKPVTELPSPAPVDTADTREVPECLPIPTFEGPSTRKQRRRR